MSWSVVTYLGFGLLGGAVVGYWTWSATGDRGLAPGPLLKSLTRRSLPRLALLIGWAWLGWHLFARGSGAFN